MTLQYLCSPYKEQKNADFRNTEKNLASYSRSWQRKRHRKQEFYALYRTLTFIRIGRLWEAGHMALRWATAKPLKIVVEADAQTFNFLNWRATAENTNPLGGSPDSIMKCRVTVGLRCIPKWFNQLKQDALFSLKFFW